MNPTLPRRAVLVAGLGAGLVSGITVALFAAIAQARMGGSTAGTYDFFASVLIGPQAAGNAWAIPLGIVVLFAATIFWAYGYLYAALRQEQLLTRPIVSGICYGVIVWFISQAVLVGAGKFEKITIYTFDRDMLGSTIFFGIPLAFVASRLMRGR